MPDLPHTRRTLRIGHSPDPDDAFMWYPLANFTGPGGEQLTPKIDTRGYAFEHILDDIQSLNRRSQSDDPDDWLEITALSIHQLPYIADRYVLTTCGSSMGDGYGPMVVAKEAMNLRDLVTPIDVPSPNKRNRPRLAIPGERTTAWLALQLLLKEVEGVEPGADRAVDTVHVPFDQIIPRVTSGEFEAGLIIHEGQLTYSQAGLACIADLGKWWTQSRGLPLPLGGNAIRRDVGDAAALGDICTVLLESIRYALAHRGEAVGFALNYARDMGRDLADEFVGMYVNDWTLDYGETGQKAVRQLIGEGVDAGIVPSPAGGAQIDFVAPR